MSDDDILAEVAAIRRSAATMAEHEGEFFSTPTFKQFQKRVLYVLETREARLKVGIKGQKGAALIGPAGTGKSRMVQQVIHEYQEVAEATGGREFGSKIVSVVVLGRATIKETLRAILREMDYPCEANRDVAYLTLRMQTLFQSQQVAALHLDEVQDSGRYKTSDSMEEFAKKFRNLMQPGPWPICLILTATLQGREFINHDQTLTRRTRPIEILPMTYEEDAQILRHSRPWKKR